MTNEESSRSPSPGLRSVTLHRNRVLEGVRREEAGRGGRGGSGKGRDRETWSCHPHPTLPSSCTLFPHSPLGKGQVAERTPEPAGAPAPGSAHAAGGTDWVFR